MFSYYFKIVLALEWARVYYSARFGVGTCLLFLNFGIVVACILYLEFMEKAYRVLDSFIYFWTSCMHIKCIAQLKLG